MGYNHYSNLISSKCMPRLSVCDQGWAEINRERKEPKKWGSFKSFGTVASATKDNSLCSQCKREI